MSAGARVALAVGILLPIAGFAQIRLGLAVQPSPALDHERVMARLNILNNTGDPLELGSNGNAQVRFVLKDHRGMPALRWQGDGEVWPATTIPVTLMGTVTNRLNTLYRLDPGSYSVEAEIRWGTLVFSSEKKYLEVVPGVVIAELKAGLPGGRGTRHFTLRVLNRDRQDHLFLRADDPVRSVCLGVIDLGRVVRMEEPAMRMDGSGYLHVLHQSGPYDHIYSVLSPDGDLDRSSSYSGEYKVVRLKTMQDGTVELNESASGDLPPVRAPDTIAQLPLGWKDRHPGKDK